MPTVRLSQAQVEKIKAPKSKTQYLDQNLTGFMAVAYPSGRVSYAVRGRVNGEDKLITIGKHPALTVAAAKEIARGLINQMHQGIDPKQAKEQQLQLDKALGVTLSEMVESYLNARQLKSEYDYRNCITKYLSDWLDKPIRSITRKSYEARYIHVRNTVSQASATKLHRYLSAILNWAKADEIAGERLITENVTDVVKDKRYSAAVKPRSKYLEAPQIESLMDYFTRYRVHPEWKPDGVSEQGCAYILLLLYTGLRRKEALSLKQEDIDYHNKVFIVREPKNGIDHYVPMSFAVEGILKSQRNSSPWLFPSKVTNSHWADPRKQVEKINEASGVKFSLHDLRRTFATHARLLGMDYDLIRRSMNHKSGGSITDSYIVERVGLIRPVFDKIAEGFEEYSYGNFTGKELPQEYYDNLADLTSDNEEDECRPDRLTKLQMGKSVVVHSSKKHDIFVDEVARWAEANQLYVYCGDKTQYAGHKRSKWYNPFHKKLKTLGRDTVCDLYKENLSDELKAQISELKGKALGCWCHPKRCHCDYLVELANNQTN